MLDAYDTAVVFRRKCTKKIGTKKKKKSAPVSSVERHLSMAALCIAYEHFYKELFYLRRVVPGFTSSISAPSA